VANRVCRLMPIRYGLVLRNKIKTKAGVLIGPTATALNDRMVRKSVWSISDSVYFLSDGSYLNDRLCFLMTLLLSDTTLEITISQDKVSSFESIITGIYDPDTFEYLGDKLTFKFTNGLILTVTHHNRHYMGELGVTGISGYVYTRLCTSPTIRIPVITSDNPPYVISGSNVEILSLTK